jgi:hypothetical protein
VLVAVIVPVLGVLAFGAAIYTAKERGRRARRPTRGGDSGSIGIFASLSQVVSNLVSGGGIAVTRQGTGTGVREPFTNPFSSLDSEAIELDVINTQTGAVSL